ncbi:MAG: hypothetical protein ACR2QF_11290, partial [Geminicoccaceae bacterium]
MTKSRTMLVALGPAVPVVPIPDFEKLRLPKSVIENAWQIVGPTVERNMHGFRRLEFWQLFALAYLEGLE